MKQIKTLFLLLVVTLMSISLTACGDDNDEPGGGDIVGTWEADYIDWFVGNGQSGVLESQSKVYIRFYDDNTYISISDFVYSDEWVEIFGVEKHEIEIDRGTYKITGNTISIQSTTDPESTSMPATFNVKGNKMTLIALGLTLTFTRISDSVINKYLN